jgi:hypothetical protein
MKIISLFWSIIICILGMIIICYGGNDVVPPKNPPKPKPPKPHHHQHHHHNHHNGSTDGGGHKRPRINKEPFVLDKAREMMIHYNLSQPRYPLLITVFMNASSARSVKIIKDNIVTVSRKTSPLLSNSKLNISSTAHSLLRFAIVFYGGNPNEIRIICDHPELSPFIVHCKRAIVSYSPLHSTIPKPLLYPEVLHVLPNFRKVMFLDEDISLTEFNYTSFMSIWDCAFAPNQPPPLVVQALIRENTQFYDFVHYSSWKNDTTEVKRSNVIASAAGFIEQQIPAFDGFFLTWFIQYIISWTYSEAMNTESDW